MSHQPCKFVFDIFTDDPIRDTRGFLDVMIRYHHPILQLEFVLLPHFVGFHLIYMTVFAFGVFEWWRLLPGKNEIGHIIDYSDDLVIRVMATKIQQNMNQLDINGMIYFSSLIFHQHHIWGANFSNNLVLKVLRLAVTNLYELILQQF